jgi:hypothetical protein
MRQQTTHLHPVFSGDKAAHHTILCSTKMIDE